LPFEKSNLNRHPILAPARPGWVIRENTGYGYIHIPYFLFMTYRFLWYNMIFDVQVNELTANVPVNRMRKPIPKSDPMVIHPGSCFDNETGIR
jgi:hypothetical protein